MDRRLPELRTRLCPKCQVEMVSTRLDPGVTVEVCPKCRGTWLDHGELKELVSKRISERADPRVLLHGQRTGHACPDCERVLFERLFRPDSTIKIHQCTECAGMFVGPGDLRRMKEHLRSIGLVAG